MNRIWGNFTKHQQITCYTCFRRSFESLTFWGKVPKLTPILKPYKQVKTSRCTRITFSNVNRIRGNFTKHQKITSHTCFRGSFESLTFWGKVPKLTPLLKPYKQVKTSRCTRTTFSNVNRIWGNFTKHQQITCYTCFRRSFESLTFWGKVPKLTPILKPYKQVKTSPLYSNNFFKCEQNLGKLHKTSTNNLLHMFPEVF